MTIESSMCTCGYAHARAAARKCTRAARAASREGGTRTGQTAPHRACSHRRETENGLISKAASSLVQHDTTERGQHTRPERESGDARVYTPLDMAYMASWHRISARGGRAPRSGESCQDRRHDESKARVRWPISAPREACQHGMERWHGTITTSRRNRVCSAYNNGVLLQNMSKARSVLCSCAMSYSNGENGIRITLGFSTTFFLALPVLGGGLTPTPPAMMGRTRG